ncbi:MAG: glycerol kinase GlpK [Candidatus Margulisbacteria bacterium]|nr:glycerol kinase GlpK [Candidatus Margulisiibacteriota bacterium]
MTILAIDQGTTGTTTVLYNKEGRILKKAYREFTQIYPKPGWVEHDPLEIWNTVVETVNEVSSAYPDKILALGLTNQRETTVIWDKKTSLPVYNAIVWQCRRTASICDSLREHQDMVKQKTGLPLDAYFSATKIMWILKNIPDLNISDLLFGTIDTWLIWKLTNGNVHATDYTNASRTMLYNIFSKNWDSELLSLFEVPEHILPDVKNSCADFGYIETIPALKGTRVSGVAGDQQAALFGQTCFYPGEIKNTYGTGCFIMMNTGDKPFLSKQGLITTLAVNELGHPCFALEGSIFIGGAVIQWLRDELGLVQKASDSEQIAVSVADNNGVYIVPAFVGLGAPHWDMQARGIIAGLTRGSNKKHLVRAALESMAYQSADVVNIMESESEIPIKELKVDGGAVANNFLMQFQSDILNKTILRPIVIESTSLGAAMLAGLNCSFWKNTAELKKTKTIDTSFTPHMETNLRQKLLSGWQHAVRQAKTR